MLLYPRVIAHRCGGAFAPENTLAGLRVAAELGVTGVEFDVMLTRDGSAVLIHDETLERTTNGHGRVAEHDLAALQRLDAGITHAPQYSGERIPTFEQAWQSCADLGLWANIEIKPSEGRDVATATVLGNCLRDCWRADAGVVSSFSETALLAFAERAPDIPRALLVTEIPGDWQARLAGTGCVALHCKGDQGDLPVRLDKALAAGVPVACYTINNRVVGERLLAAGVAALFSDRLDIW